MIYTFTVNPSLDRTIVLDQLITGRLNRGKVERINAGGKGINISRFLNILGFENIAITFLGGSSGESIQRELVKEGIRYRFFNADGETRTNITLVDAKNKQITKINEEGPWINKTEIINLFDFIAQELKTGDTWVFSGNLAPGLEKDFYRSLIALAKEKGCVCILDSSGQALKMGIESQPQIIHINEEEADFLIGSPNSKDDRFVKLAEVLTIEGIEMVSISMGEAGALFATKRKKVFVEAPRIDAQSTVGAGDALLAGIIYGIKKGFDLEQTSKFAVAAGCAKVMEKGTDPFKMGNIQLHFHNSIIHELK
jgi:1-phosphofructokinase